jgi:myo-inositol-1(or 4)-monophosphatase
MTDDADAAAVAADAVRAGGAYLRERFETGETDADYRDSDVKAGADRESERRVLDVIGERRPDDAVYAEESGDHAGTSDVRWIVDPLDGTNNFTVGLSTFATAAAAIDGRGPLAAAVYQPVTEDLYVARRDEGVRLNGDPISVRDGDTVSLSRATVPIVIGHDVKGDPDLAARTDAVATALEGACKRHVWSWAPTVYWGLFAHGRMDAFVCFHPDREEQVAGELLAREAGGVARERDGLTVFADRAELLDDLWAVVAPAAD